MSERERERDLERRLDSLQQRLDALRCARQEDQLDTLRTEVIPELCKEIGKLQVYQVVTWAMVFLTISGLVGIAWKFLSSGIVP